MKHVETGKNRKFEKALMQGERILKKCKLNPNRLSLKQNRGMYSDIKIH